jgi:periplasmic divalent cation tolerance protein
MSDNSSESGFVTITTSIDSDSAASSLARGLVKARLAACVQRTNVTSVYRWKGCIEEAEEVLLTIKTRSGLCDAAVAFISRNHTYELPEILVTPVLSGSSAYLEWVSAETALQQG